jgi:hypothetical protein
VAVVGPHDDGLEAALAELRSPIGG